MALRADPSEFARRQAIGRLLAPVLSLLIVPSSAVAFVFLADVHGLGQVACLLTSALLVAAIYFAWARHEFRGGIGRPRPLWIVDLADDSLHINVGGVLVLVRLADVRTAELVGSHDTADSWLEYEHEVLELALADGARLMVPGSSIGFEAVKRRLDAIRSTLGPKSSPSTAP